MTDHELETNLHSLAKTNRQLVRMQSPWLAFWRGVLSGIGATVGAAIVIALLSWFLGILSGFDFLAPTIQRILPFVNYQNSPKSPVNILPVPSYRSADQTGLDQVVASPSVSPTTSPTPLSVTKILKEVTPSPSVAPTANSTPTPTPTPSSTPTPTSSSASTPN